MDILILLLYLFVAIVISLFLTAFIWVISDPQQLARLIKRTRRSHASHSTDLVNLDRKGYADWLFQGLQSIYSSSAFERAHAFSSLYQLISQQETIFEDLIHFYEDHLPKTSKSAFRQAIGDVLYDQANNPDASPSVVLALIHLSGRVKAMESLQALVQTIDNELLVARVRSTETLNALGSITNQRPLDRQRQGILDEILKVLKILAPSRDVYKTAFDLANSTDFDDGYLFELMKIMVECDPSHAATIVLTFEPRLSQLRQTSLNIGGNAWNTFSEAAEDWAQYIMLTAPISWIIDLWQKANHERDQGWIFEYIFKNQAKPIVWLEEFPDKISVRCEQKILSLKASRKEYNTVENAKRILLTYQLLSEVSRHPISAIYSIVPKIRIRSWTGNAERTQITHSESLSRESQKTLGALMKQKAELIDREVLGG